MAPKKASKAKAASSPSSTPSKPPKPFTPAPTSLAPFLTTPSLLSKKHIYIVHVDTKPASFKRKIFLVPVAMNLAVFLLFLWRIYYILPHYLLVFSSTLGYPNATTLVASELTWTALCSAILRRTLTFLVDFLLAIFVWPWPVEFVFGSRLVAANRGNGSPVGWRWAVGFREHEIYVRKSRDTWWDGGKKTAGDLLVDDNAQGRSMFFGQVRDATSALLLREKTGYLTMNGEWDLDWAAMVRATRLVDEGVVEMETFARAPVVLYHHDRFGWLVVDLGLGGGGGVGAGGEGGVGNAREEERRKKVFKFRDALAAVGKEDLFFRWIEIVQFETSQPGGFTGKKQLEVATKIRDLFKENGIDFDEFWRESVGSETLAGME